MQVPLLDLTRQYKNLQEEMEREVLKVLSSGYYILGPQVTGFEEEMSAFTSAKYAIGLNSGTDALRMSLRAFDVGPGDEVITSSFSYFATCEVISELGAEPIFCDIEYDTFNIDPEDVKRKITDKTKAILPVHLFGQLCDMEAIMAIAREKEIPVIEDACQAIGARSAAGNAGAIGDTGTFSFFPSKNLGAAGDGGMLTTSNSDIVDLTKSLRMHGTITDRYRHEILGYNSRLDEIQAAVLRVKLRHLKEYIEQRREHAEFYKSQLSTIDGIEPAVETEGFYHTYHQYTVRIKNGKRDEVFDFLRKNDVGCAIYYKVPLHKQPVYGDSCGDIELPVCEKAAEEVLSLPVFPELTVDEREMVVETLHKAMK